MSDMNETVGMELLESTKLKISVVGLGNAGGQVALAAANEGIDVMVINTSTKDLDNRVLGKNVSAYQIGDGRGSGKNRENAMELLMMDGKQGIAKLFSNPFFKATVEPADVVFCAFSTAGGTGSGIGPKVAEMIHKAYPAKVVIPYGILPKRAESVMAQSNALGCVDDITKLGVPYMLADLAYYEDKPQEVGFREIARYMVTAMRTIRGDFLKYTTSGMADERDMLTVVSEPGYLMVHFKKDLTESMLNGKTLQGYLIEQIKSSPTCKPQKDGLVQYNLLVSNVNSSVDDAMKVGDYSELNSFIGEPKSTWANYAVDDSWSEFEVYSITSGMTIPMDRFAEAKAKIKLHKDKYEQQSKLNLSEDRSKLTVTGNQATHAQIMGSQQSSQADMSFLDGL